MVETTYTEKLPRDVRGRMDKITQSGCNLVEHRIKGITGNRLGLLTINLHAKYAFIESK